MICAPITAPPPALLVRAPPAATIGSEVVASAILGLPNPHAAAYNPSRVLPGATLKVRACVHARVLCPP